MLDVADGILFEGRQELVQISAGTWEGAGHVRQGAYMHGQSLKAGS